MGCLLFKEVRIIISTQEVNVLRPDTLCPIISMCWFN